MADKLPEYWLAATAYLKKRDRVLARLIAQYPQTKLRLRKDAFTTLARAISGQQISVKAADAIWARFVKTVQGKEQKISPHAVLALDTPILRACGFSLRKVEYIQSLAENFVAKKVNGRKHLKMPDDAIREELVTLKGIGPWTADMYLMFNLWRPDVLPLGDLGLIRAMEISYCGGEKTPTAELRRIAEPWSPYRTVATWYLWRSLDPVAVEY